MQEYFNHYTFTHYTYTYVYVYVYCYTFDFKYLKKIQLNSEYNISKRNKISNYKIIENFQNIVDLKYIMYI